MDPSIGIADETESAPPGAVPGDRPTTVKTVSGLVQSGLDSDSKVRRAIDKVAQHGRITQEYVIVEAGRKPDPADLVLGIALLVGIPVIGWLVLRPRQSPVAAAGPSALPPPPLPRT